jgi:hypothetical protein
MCCVWLVGDLGDVAEVKAGPDYRTCASYNTVTVVHAAHNTVVSVTHITVTVVRPAHNTVSVTQSPESPAVPD